MRASISESIISTFEDLHTNGIIDEEALNNISSLYTPEIKEYTPERIIDIRKRFKLNRPAMAQLLNISPSTIRQWEKGTKKPKGASKKLLDVAERKGLEGLI